MNDVLRKSAKYFTIYYFLTVLTVMILSSLGTFFHFLLQHEMSIIESWLHQNKWEILILSKLFSIFLLKWWFGVKLYQLKSFSDMKKDFFIWPKFHAVVVSFFCLIAFASLGQIAKPPQSFLYGYQFFISILGVVTFFFLDIIVLTYIQEIFHRNKKFNVTFVNLIYVLIFSLACYMCIPDYYQNNKYFVFIFLTLLILYSDSKHSWGNALCFLLVFSAPMVSLLGIDPVWGDDFSLFNLEKKPGLTFLAVIWVISFLYYNQRETLIIFGLRLIRWSKRYAWKS